MTEIIKDLHNNSLESNDEIIITYKGPSFENKMEISDLRKQLKSSEYLIKDLVDELHQNKELSITSKELTIYLEVRKGSFEEIISIALSNPIVSGIISGCVVSLFNKLLNKKKEDKPLIENMTNNYYFVKNTYNIINPLSKDGDKIKIKSKNNPEDEIEIEFTEKRDIYDKLKEIEKESLFETFEEEFFGYISRVDLDSSKFGFKLEGTEKHIPVTFDEHLNLNDIKEILGERIKISSRAKYRNKELYKLEITNYELKRRKTLKDFK